MPPIEGLEVIDLGCGEGANTRRFARLGGRLTGVDLSAALIARARAAERQEPLGIRYEVSSFSRLEVFEAGSFDCALSTMALMDGPDFGAAMVQAHRLLVPGGRLCFSILHPCFVTAAFEWIHEGDAKYTGLRVGRYFDKAPFVEHWRFSKHPNPQSVEPFEVPRFPRTLSNLINPICQAGFRINEIQEPRPDEALCREHPWLLRWRDHAPLVLFVSAVKT